MSILIVLFTSLILFTSILYLFRIIGLQYEPPLPPEMPAPEASTPKTGSWDWGDHGWGQGDGWNQSPLEAYTSNIVWRGGNSTLLKPDRPNRDETNEEDDWNEEEDWNEDN